MTENGLVWHRWLYKTAPSKLKNNYDIVIIGAGVVGCALAYELSQYELSVLVLEKNTDVGEATSKSNSAIIHTGFDAVPGSLESKLVTRAAYEWPEMAEKLKAPMIKCGAIMVALNDEQAEQLPALYEKALQNNQKDVRLLSRDEVLNLAPNVGDSVKGGMIIPRESIIDPFQVPIGFAEIAVANGVDIIFGSKVETVTKVENGLKICINDGLEINTKNCINAAGLWSRELTKKHAGKVYDTNPRRGQFILYDKSARNLVDHIYLPIPTKKTKGMLVAPTIFGNILAGPTAEDLAPDETEATITTKEGISQVKDNALKMCPSLSDHPPIASYAGLRCNSNAGSYLVEFNDGLEGMNTITAVRSTGLTSSFTLARYMIKGLVENCSLNLVKKENAVDSRPDSKWPGWWKPPYEQEHVSDEDSEIVCYCENISLGEINRALDSCLQPKTMDALKRRTRSQMGRCQAFNCGVPIASFVAKKQQTQISEVTKKGLESAFAGGAC
ncbi:MAG: NAD(P)/FAD-dependent oxidoreductase [Lentisphaerales bacterium]|nr:NAD(P)/FAD-dependent oxidoreductase [Lentisphaerales bacterium]